MSGEIIAQRYGISTGFYHGRLIEAGIRQKALFRELFSGWVCFTLVLVWFGAAGDGET